MLFSIVLALLLAEGTIRLFPNLLNDKLRHAAFSKYDTLPGGIFRFEGLSRTRFMRADHRTRAYSHGYFWTHETDARGYRNPAGIDDRRILLLGDSLVYGHGVEADETVAHFLRTEHSVAAYDMSAQGQCIYEHYLALRLLLDELRPETALLFVYVNDIDDLEKLSRAPGGSEIPEIVAFDYGVLRDRIELLQSFRDPLMVRVAYSSAIVRMTAKTRRWRPARPPESETPPQWRPPHESKTRPGNAMGAVLDHSRFASIELYFDTVLADLAERCDRLGARLVVIHLIPPAEKEWRERDRAQAKLQRSLADDLSPSRSRTGRHPRVLRGTHRLDSPGRRTLQPRREPGVRRRFSLAVLTAEWSSASHRRQRQSVAAISDSNRDRGSNQRPHPDRSETPRVPGKAATSGCGRDNGRNDLRPRDLPAPYSGLPWRRATPWLARTRPPTSHHAWSQPLKSTTRATTPWDDAWGPSRPEPDAGTVTHAAATATAAATAAATATATVPVADGAMVRWVNGAMFAMPFAMPFASSASLRLCV